MDEIWFYIAQDDPDTEDRFVRLIVSRFPKLASVPKWDGNAKNFPRLRSFPVGKNIIFYHPMENGIEIVRVLHGARDLPPLFE